MERPALIHVVTQKGKGYQPAESHPDVFHGVAPFYSERGEARQPRSGASCGQIAARLLSDMADTDIRIAVISAAMPDGTGMSVFQQGASRPLLRRGHRRGARRDHGGGHGRRGHEALCGHLLDLHGACLRSDADRRVPQFAAGDVPAGSRGASSAQTARRIRDVFDLSYLRSMPNMIVAAPRDVRDLKKLIALSAAVT